MRKITTTKTYYYHDPGVDYPTSLSIVTGSTGIANGRATIWFPVGDNITQITLLGQAQVINSSDTRTIWNTVIGSADTQFSITKQYSDIAFDSDDRYVFPIQYRNGSGRKDIWFSIKNLRAQVTTQEWIEDPEQITQFYATVDNKINDKGIIGYSNVYLNVNTTPKGAVSQRHFYRNGVEIRSGGQQYPVAALFLQEEKEYDTFTFNAGLINGALTTYSVVVIFESGIQLTKSINVQGTSYSFLKLLNIRAQRDQSQKTHIDLFVTLSNYVNNIEAKDKVLVKWRRYGSTTEQYVGCAPISKGGLTYQIVLDSDTSFNDKVAYEFQITIFDDNGIPSTGSVVLPTAQVFMNWNPQKMFFGFGTANAQQNTFAIHTDYNFINEGKTRFGAQGTQFGEMIYGTANMTNGVCEVSSRGILWSNVVATCHSGPYVIYYDKSQSDDSKAVFKCSQDGIDKNIQFSYLVFIQ